MVSWEWWDEPNTFRLFMYLIMTCNFKNTRWRGIVLGVGETIKSLEFLSDAVGLSVSQIRTSIDHLKMTGELTQRWHGKHRILKLKSYERHQVDRTENRNEIAVKSQQVKNEKNEKNNILNFCKYFSKLNQGQKAMLNGAMKKFEGNTGTPPKKVNIEIMIKRILKGEAI